MLLLPNVLINRSINILLRYTNLLIFCNVGFINTNLGIRAEMMKYKSLCNFCLGFLCLKANDY